MLSLNEIKDIQKAYDIRPKKSLGQNFIIDKNIISKMVRLFQLMPSDIVLEIGPGLGALTEPLSKKCNRVIAVEKDAKLSQVLRQLLKSRQVRNVSIVHEDFLDYRIGDDVSVIAGNIPYNISSPILEKIINKFANSKKVIYLTVQKEFADRICAKKGSRDYSSLTLFVELYASARVILKISRNCFYPQPAVDSVTLKINFLEKPKVNIGDKVFFHAIIRNSFMHRRKTIVNSLALYEDIKQSKHDLMRLLQKSGVNPDSRPEMLGLDDFAKIYRSLNEE